MLGERLVTYVAGKRLDLGAVLSSVTPGGLAMVCGPLRMLDEARRIWKSLGRPMTDLRFETFGSSGTHAPEAFRVRLPQLNREIVVPENQSMLDALESAGIGVVSDCRRGECGVCAINIIGVEGTVDHRDVFFSEHQKQANAKICACVSRAIGTIVARSAVPAGPCALRHLAQKKTPAGEAGVCLFWEVQFQISE